MTVLNPKIALFIVATLNLIFIPYCIYYINANGGLPSPFFFDYNDTFMDYFNTYYWSFDNGRYSIWRSIYLPISFLYFQLIGSTTCILSSDNSFSLRECDHSAILYLGIFSLLSSILLMFYLRRNISFLKKLDYITIFIIASTSFPMIFAFERGNLIIIAYFFFLIFLINKNNNFGLLGLVICILFKPYAITLYPPIYLKNGVVSIAKHLTILLIILIIFNILLDDENIYLILDNLIDFSSSLDYSYFEKLQYTTSIKMWYSLLTDEVSNYVLADFRELYNIFFIIVLSFKLLSSLVVISLIICSYLFRNKLDLEVLLFSYALSFLILTDSAGPYGVLFLIPLVFYMTFKLGWTMTIYPFLCLLIAFDPFYIFAVDFPVNSLFFGYETIAKKGITVGSLARPFFLLLLGCIGLGYMLGWLKPTELNYLKVENS
jgi:hypothetical protein